MALDREFQRDTSNQPKDLIVGLVVSIILHSVLLIEVKDWLQAVATKHKSSAPIEIEYIEIPSTETKPPQETKRRAARDSAAGGKAAPERPISAARLATPETPKTSASSSTKSPTPKSAKSTPLKSVQPTAVLPDPSPPKLQPEPRKISPQDIPKPEPKPQEAAVPPSTPKLQPESQTAIVKRLRANNPEPTMPQPTLKPPVTPITPNPPKLQPESQTAIVKRLRANNPELPMPQPTLKPPVTPITPNPPKLQPESQTAIVKRLRANNPELPMPQPILKPPVTAAIPNIPKPQSKPQKATVVPTSEQKPLNRQPNEEPPSSKPSAQQLTTRTTPTISQPQPSPQKNKNPVTPKPSATQLAARSTSQTTPQAQPSQTSGAARRLGGPINLSSRNLGNNSWAASPNSNRSNPGTAGVDASRDPDFGPYLEQLRQQVRQQWLPGITQSSRQTVVHFVVSRSGIISSLQIVRSSGSSALDEAAISAIKRAAPFAPLPASYSDDFIKIKFTFNINVYGQLDLGSR